MTAQVKNEWITALESSNYTQGVDFLYDTVKNEYSALGVLLTLIEYPLPDNSWYVTRKNSTLYTSLDEVCITITEINKLVNILNEHLTFEQIATIDELNSDLNTLDERKFKNVLPYIKEITCTNI